MALFHNLYMSGFMTMVSRVSGESLEGCKGIRGIAGRLQGYQGNQNILFINKFIIYIHSHIGI
jgi:hypothetical protein